MIFKNKRSRIILFAILAVTAIVFLTLVFYTPRQPEFKEISLIVYGDDTNRWENLRQGAELAANELGVEVGLVTMTSENDADEQIDIINREVINGTDALLIAASDSDKIGEYINNAKLKIPVVYVETGAEELNNHVCISANDYEMGYALGERICQKEKPIAKIAIISDCLQRNSIKNREKGLLDALDGNINNVVMWKRNDNEKGLQMRKFIQRALVSEAVDVIVTLDNSMTDSLMDALVNLNKTSRVYSISTSDKAVYNLDQGPIKSLTYQTEFSIGYIGAQYALDEKNAKKKYKNEEIYFRVVDKEDMYDYDNQTLLFPFVK